MKFQIKFLIHATVSLLVIVKSSYSLTQDQFCLLSYRVYFNESLVTNTECSISRDVNCSHVINFRADLLEPADKLWFEERIYRNIKIDQVNHGNWCGAWNGSTLTRPVTVAAIEEHPVNQHVQLCSLDTSIRVKDLDLSRLIRTNRSFIKGIYNLTYRFLSETGVTYAILMLQGYIPGKNGSNGLVKRKELEVES